MVKETLSKYKKMSFLTLLKQNITYLNQNEHADGTGLVSGRYSVLLPDGRIQHVHYTADPYGGFKAEVRLWFIFFKLDGIKCMYITQLMLMEV